MKTLTSPSPHQLVGMQVADADHRADEASLVLAFRQQFEVLLLGRRILAAEQRVQSAHVLGMLVTDRVVDLVEERDGLGALVGERDFGALRERHRQPDVAAAGGSDRVHGRLIGHDLAVGEAKEVADRALDAGMLLTVPPGANQQRALGSGILVRCYPDVADRARPCDVAQLDFFAGLDGARRSSLARGTQAAGRLTAVTRLAGRVLKGDRARHQAGVQVIGCVDQMT